MQKKVSKKIERILKKKKCNKLHQWKMGVPPKAFSRKTHWCFTKKLLIEPNTQKLRMIRQKEGTVRVYHERIENNSANSRKADNDSKKIKILDSIHGRLSFASRPL